MIQKFSEKILNGEKVLHNITGRKASWVNIVWTHSKRHIVNEEVNERFNKLHEGAPYMTMSYKKYLGKNKYAKRKSKCGKHPLPRENSETKLVIVQYCNTKQVM